MARGDVIPPRRLKEYMRGSDGVGTTPGEQDLPEIGIDYPGTAPVGDSENEYAVQYAQAKTGTLSDASPGPVPSTSGNLFDTFGEPDDVPASEGLQPAQAPSLGESLSTNFGTFKQGLLSAVRNFADKRTSDRGDRGEVAQPGDSPLAGKPSQAEVDDARGRLYGAKRDWESYESFSSPGLGGKAVGLLGGLAGGLIQPENLLTAGGVVANGFAHAFGSSLAARVVGAGVETGLVNAALDVPTQGLQVGAGIQDGYSPLQTAAAFGVGGVAGGGMEWIARSVGRSLAPRDVPRAPDVVPAADGEPLAVTVRGGQPDEAVPLAPPTPVERVADEQAVREAAATSEPAPVRPEVTPAAPETVPARTEPDATVSQAVPEPLPPVDTGTRPGQSLAAFIARNGGIEMTGDARAMDLNRMFVPGGGTVARKNGKSIDGFWRERLIEEGYLKPDADGYAQRDITNELYDLLGQEAAGRKHYREGEGPHTAPDRDGEIESAAVQIRDMLDEVGTRRQDIDSPALYDAAEALVRGTESSPEIAYERAVMRRAMNDERTASIVREVYGDDIPFPEPRGRSGEADTGNGRAGAGPRPQGGTDAASGGLQGARETAGETRGDTVEGYTTAKGSTYVVHEDGTTTRNKAERADAGHEGDKGVKARTEKTIYVDKDVASALSGAGLTDVGGKGYRLIIKDDKATLLSWNKKGEKWGAAPDSRDIPFTTTPEAGRSPLELWSKANDVPGYEAYKRQHAGNEIVSVRTRNVETRPLLAQRPDEQAMAARTGQAVANIDDNARFPNRQLLVGEDSKARTLPANATPEEVAAFRVTDAMRGLAERIGRKIEVDGRFSIKGALGTYSTKTGVIRIRMDGDFEVFSHELAHALDSDLQRAHGAEWNRFVAQNDATLKGLDANAATTGGAADASEGLAELMRIYINNPAYAEKQHPALVAELEQWLSKNASDTLALMRDANRVAQIDSGMAPMQAMSSMVANALEPRGVRKFAAEAKRDGIIPTLATWFDRAYAGMFGKDHWARRMTLELREAYFQETGKPLPEFTRDNMGFSDPYKSFRALPGAQQAAIDAVYYGVRDYGKALDGSKSPSLYDALHEAFGGRVTAINDPDDPMVKAFSGYLIARRSRALYERWANGDLANPPVRRSRAEVNQAVTDFETQYPQFVGAADKVFGFANAMWQKKFDAGLITREVFDAVNGAGGEYVPFYRDFRDSKAGGGGGNGGSLERAGKGPRIKGSTRDILDPIHSLVFDAVQTERVIALNDTTKWMHRLAMAGGEFSGRFIEKVPNSELRGQSFDLAEGLRQAARAKGLDKADTEVIIRHLEEMVGDDMTATVFKATDTTPRGERIMFYWDAGERVALKVGDNEVSRQYFDLISATSAAERDVVMAMIGRVNGLFSQLITNAPQFALKNLVMDNISRMFIARNTGLAGRLPGAAIVQGIYTQIFEREFAKSYAATGGIRGGVVSAAARELDEARGIGAVSLRPKDLKAMGEEAMRLLGNPKDLALEVVKSPLTALEKVLKGIETTETVGRLGQAKLVFKHIKKQGLSDEEAFHAAVYEARDILDYDRKGWAVQAAARTLPFLNAGFQGLDRSQRNLFGAPFQAAVQAYKRGGYAALDGEMKTALLDAVQNWGFIAAGGAITMGYYAYNSDNPVYQRMTEYMRKRYYVFPGAQDADGKVNVITVPKPFDHAGGIFGAIEGFMDGIRRQDPETWHRVVGALADGFIPRQMSDPLGSLPPIVKVPIEVKTNKRFGFDGGPNFPIVPQKYEKLPPEQQYNGNTSWLAKKMGQWFGVSPLVADHVMAGFGATTARDANNLATAIADDQPNVTVKDAMTRMFFGALYREQRGGGAFRSDLMQIMGKENGEYAVAANGYVAAKEAGDEGMASAIYGRGNELAKTIMTIRSGEFKPEQRQLHPLERTASLGEILSSVTRDLTQSRVEILDRSRKRGEEREYITLQPTTARAIANTVGSLMAEETRNGLKIAGQPGYEAYDVIDTKARYEAIKALSPEVAAEVEKRMKKAHILPAETVQTNWPEVKRRLLEDRDQAKLKGLGRVAR